MSSKKHRNITKKSNSLESKWLFLIAFIIGCSISSLLMLTMDTNTRPKSTTHDDSIDQRIKQLLKSGQPQNFFDPVPRENPLPKAMDFFDQKHHHKFLWGTFRSGMYYGIRSRTNPQHISAGLLWTTLVAPKKSKKSSISLQKFFLRHECSQEDRLKSYGWKDHDGTSYGFQKIVDGHHHVILDTYFLRLDTADSDAVKASVSDSAWISRIQLHPQKSKPEAKVSLFFYMDLSCKDDSMDNICRNELGEWRINIRKVGHIQIEAVSGLFHHFNTDFRLPMESIGEEIRFHATNKCNSLNIENYLKELRDTSGNIMLDGQVENHSTLMIIQAIVFKNSTLDILSRGRSFNNLSSEIITSFQADSYMHVPLSTKLSQAKKKFETRFESAFNLSSTTINNRPFNKNEIDFAKSAFSQLMGGLSYFYGSSTIFREHSNEVLESFSSSLFSAVPSRSFFPRGFLWDEGFHQLLVQKFDHEITMDVIAHWLDRMHGGIEFGWIAREQILGKEAEKRVPKEFIQQYTTHANPPTLLLTLERLITQAENNNAQIKDFLLHIYPRLEAWYAWYIQTQSGAIEGTFRWRGRSKNDGKLNPNTLASGLDDYPRASSPSDKEIHVDLLCWMIKATEILSKISKFIINDTLDRSKLFKEYHQHLLKTLNNNHWSETWKSYFDKGEHSNDGKIVENVVVACKSLRNQDIIHVTASFEALHYNSIQCPESHPQYLYPLGDGKGGLLMKKTFVPGKTEYQFVKHFGYLNLFPLFLNILPSNSSHILPLLDLLYDPKRLWSKQGIRSMSMEDSFYHMENAPYDAPYWRGPIWININYLICISLLNYAKEKNMNTEHGNRWLQIYRKLRIHLIELVEKEYETTQFLWEQYEAIESFDSQETKKTNIRLGKRAHPFTGWTSLVVNLMSLPENPVF